MDVVFEYYHTNYKDAVSDFYCIHSSDTYFYEMDSIKRIKRVKNMLNMNNNNKCKNKRNKKRLKIKEYKILKKNKKQNNNNIINKNKKNKKKKTRRTSTRRFTWLDPSTLLALVLGECLGECLGERLLGECPLLVSLLDECPLLVPFPRDGPAPLNALAVRRVFTVNIQGKSRVKWQIS